MFSLELEAGEGLLLQRPPQHEWNAAEHGLSSLDIRVQSFIFLLILQLFLLILYILKDLFPSMIKET